MAFGNGVFEVGGARIGGVGGTICESAMVGIGLIVISINGVIGGGVAKINLKSLYGSLEISSSASVGLGNVERSFSLKFHPSATGFLGSETGKTFDIRLSVTFGVIKIIEVVL